MYFCLFYLFTHLHYTFTFYIKMYLSLIHVLLFISFIYIYLFIYFLRDISVHVLLLNPN